MHLIDATESVSTPVAAADVSSQYCHVSQQLHRYYYYYYYYY